MVKHSRRRRSTRRRHGGLSRKDEDNFLASKTEERRAELVKVGEKSRAAPKVFESVGTEQRKPKTWYSADTMAARAAASGGRTRRRRRHRR